jgi:hypothetical protein
MNHQEAILHLEIHPQAILTIHQETTLEECN